MRRGAAQRAPPASPIRSSGTSSAGGAAGEAAAEQPAAGTGEQPALPRSHGAALGLPRIPSSASTASSHSSFEGSDLLPCASQELSDDGGSTTAYALQRSGGSFSFAPLPGLGPSGTAAGQGDPPSPPPLRRLPSAPKPEGCLVLKFVSSRLICQSEQFASELTRHVGLGVPESRILRQQVGGQRNACGRCTSILSLRSLAARAFWWPPHHPCFGMPMPPCQPLGPSGRQRG